jgi:hypothetical protein
MRNLQGKGTPRGWQGFSVNEVLTFLRLWIALLEHYGQENALRTLIALAGARSRDLSIVTLVEAAK